jgi:hypothetical protein
MGTIVTGTFLGFFGSSLISGKPVLSQMQSSVAKSAAEFQPRLRGDTQGLIDETDLANYISLSQPPDLTFSDHVHRLIATYRVYRASHRTLAAKVVCSHAQRLYDLPSVSAGLSEVKIATSRRCSS